MELTQEELSAWVSSLSTDAFKAVSEAVEERKREEGGKPLNLRSKLTEAVSMLGVDEIAEGMRKDVRAGGTMLSRVYGLLDSDLDGSDPEVTVIITDHLIADKNVPKILEDCDEIMFVKCVEAVTRRLKKAKRRRIIDENSRIIPVPDAA